MKDIILNNDSDLNILNGDFEIDNSDNQNIALIVDSFMGEFKQFPLLGFGVTKYLKGDASINDIKRDLKIQLEYDNYQNAKIDIDNSLQLKIKVDSDI